MPGGQEQSGHESNGLRVGVGKYLGEILAFLLHLPPLPPVLQQPPEFDVEQGNVLLQGPELLLQQTPLVAPGSLMQGVLQSQAVHFQLFPPQGIEVLLLHLEWKERKGCDSGYANLPPKPNQVLAKCHSVLSMWHLGWEQKPPKFRKLETCA